MRISRALVSRRLVVGAAAFVLAWSTMLVETRADRLAGRDGHTDPRAHQLKDINSSVDASRGSRPREFVQVGSETFFVAERSGFFWSDFGLWKTDGTAAGTELVENIAASQLVEANGVLFFVGNEWSTGTELWTSDGTPEGTVLVKDIFPGVRGSSPGELTVVGGTLYFSAHDGVSGRELWKSDGTAEGTVMVTDIWPGVSSSSPESLTGVDDILFFRALVLGLGDELWKSDGTDAGTVLVKDIVTGAPTSSRPDQLTEVDGILFFTVRGCRNETCSHTSYSGLWKSDGSEAGTVRVKQIVPGGLRWLQELDGDLYFMASDGITGLEPWKSDGTEAGTVQVADINPGSEPSIRSFGFNPPGGFTEAGGSLYFEATDGVTGFELWRTDGTEEGTTLVRDINPGGDSEPRRLTELDGKLYFVADDGMTGLELWKTDGTVEGTERVHDLNPGIANSFSRHEMELAKAGGMLYLAANDGVEGLEPWRSDGSSAGTVRIKDTVFQWFSTLSPFTTIDGVAYFWALSSDFDGGLWMSDGTVEGTVKAPDDSPVDFAASPTVVGDTTFFTRHDGSTGRELWKTDGTPEGTVLVLDINPGAESSNPGGLTAVGGTLYFTADDGVSGRELWKSDGTEEGTVQVKDINPGADGSYPSQLTSVGGILYFGAQGVVSGNGLWKSDGTEDGTVLVKRFGDLFNSRVSDFIDLNGTLIFRLDEQLWASDGTEEGTVLLEQVDGLAWLFEVNGTLLFNGNDRISGRELWKSDGTREGTMILKDIYPGRESSRPSWPAAFDGNLYFSATDGVTGDELWKSDGTEEGTVLVRDISPGPTGSRPEWLAGTEDAVLFSASDGISGHEPWASRGEAFNTIEIHDVAPGPASSSAFRFASLGSRIIFTADDGATGFEPWATRPYVLPESILPERVLESLRRDLESRKRVGLESGLVSTLTRAEELVRQGENEPAIGRIETLVEEIERQRGATIAREDADALVQSAQQVIELLNRARAQQRSGADDPR